MNDSVYAQRAMLEVEQMQGLYDYSRNQEIARQEKERADHANAIIQLISVILFFFVIIAFVIVREVHKKRNEEKEEYKNKVSLLAKTNSEVIHLRTHEQTLSKLLKEKEKEAENLGNAIEAYKIKVGLQKESSEIRLQKSEVYNNLSKLASKGIFLTDDQWQRVYMMVIDVLPNFYKLISEKKFELSENEFKTCILIRLHFTSKDVANMIGVTQPYISKVCRSLMFKLFQKEGKSKELSEILKQYS